MHTRIGSQVSLILVATLLLSCGKSNFASGSSGSKAKSVGTPAPGGQSNAGEAACERNLSIISEPVSRKSISALEAADAVTIPVVVRDFKVEHPDFENGRGHEPNLIKETLGSDGLPIFSGIASQTITSAQSFNEWYRDVNGTNMRIDSSIILKKIAGTSKYSFDDDNYFPIDKKGFGNEGNNRNFHFTMQLESSFTYRGGEELKFKGDDDIWVFVNKKLVIDLGGVHEEMTKTIKADDLGLAVGNDYPVHVFFAERHTNASHLRIETTLQLKNQSSFYEYKVSTNVEAGEDTLTFVLEKGPAGMMIDPQTGRVTWAPTVKDVGEHEVVITVKDAKGCSASQDFVLKIEDGT